MAKKGSKNPVQSREPNREAPIRTVISTDPRVEAKKVLTDEEKHLRRQDAVRRAWAKRKELFGASGYKNGAHPKAGTAGPKAVRPTYSPEEKAARRAASVKAAWEKRKALYGTSGYKAGRAPFRTEKKEAVNE